MSSSSSNGISISSNLLSKKKSRDFHASSSNSSSRRSLLGIDEWSQIGADFNGVMASEGAGCAVALSSDGTVLIVGSPYYNNGIISVYKHTGDVWTKRLAHITVTYEGGGFDDDDDDDSRRDLREEERGARAMQDGDDDDDHFRNLIQEVEMSSRAMQEAGASTPLFGEYGGDHLGISVATSSNGDIVAAGATNNLDGAGHIRVYHLNAQGKYIQRGSDIDGESTGDAFGTSIALSSSGDILAVGGPNNDGINGDDSGHVRVYKWDGSEYSPRGNSADADIEGKMVGDRFGQAVGLSSDGDILTVGAPGNDGDTGHVRIFEFNDSASRYEQRGDTIDGDELGGKFGESIDMSSDGEVLVVGAPAYKGTGLVRVFARNATDHYAQRGSDILGDAADDAWGKTVAMSSDGSVLAVGADCHDVNGADSGLARVYALTGTEYVQRGGHFHGALDSENLGSSMALSSDGNLFVVGAEGNDEGGEDSGQVRVFTWDPIVWDIKFINLTTNFTYNGDDTVVAHYEIGAKPGEHEAFLYQRDCKTSITDIAIELDDTKVPKDPKYDNLVLRYEINKTSMLDSIIWNATASKIELCQVVHLKTGNLVIQTDRRQVFVDFNMLAGFSIDTIALGAATVEAGSSQADLTDYVKACQCNKVDLACIEADLAPNTELTVCIRTLSPDVLIDYIDGMILSQGTESMGVISNNDITFPSIASREYADSQTAVVSTRVAVNIFDFNVEKSIIITGEVVLKLAGGDGGNIRRLKAGYNSAKLDVESPFELEVKLRPDMDSESEGRVMNPGSLAPINFGFTIGLGMVFVTLACALY